MPVWDCGRDWSRSIDKAKNTKGCQSHQVKKEVSPLREAQKEPTWPAPWFPTSHVQSSEKTFLCFSVPSLWNSARAALRKQRSITITRNGCLSLHVTTHAVTLSNSPTHSSRIWAWCPWGNHQYFFNTLLWNNLNVQLSWRILLWSLYPYYLNTTHILFLFKSLVYILIKKIL